MAWPAAATDLQEGLRRLLAAYPTQIERIDGSDLVLKNGTRLPIDAGPAPRAHEDMLAAADIKDMFSQPYAPGVLAAPPGRNVDPGRARNTALFDAMYGDCAKGGGALVDVVWLPRKWGRPVKATRINGVAEKLAEVSKDLDALPPAFDRFLFPPAGTYVCRFIAGTSRRSAHGHGIAIDLATAQADYWQWGASKSGVEVAYRNRIPQEIVDIFERHGFIWGGKWYHYDTMHFEYRPELLPPARKASP